MKCLSPPSLLRFAQGALRNLSGFRGNAVRSGGEFGGFHGGGGFGGGGMHMSAGGFGGGHGR